MAWPRQVVFGLAVIGFIVIPLGCSTTHTMTACTVPYTQVHINQIHSFLSRSYGTSEIALVTVSFETFSIIIQAWKTDADSVEKTVSYATHDEISGEYRETSRIVSYRIKNYRAAEALIAIKSHASRHGGKCNKKDVALLTPGVLIWIPSANMLCRLGAYPGQFGTAHDAAFKTEPDLSMETRFALVTDVFVGMTDPESYSTGIMFEIFDACCELLADQIDFHSGVE